MVRFQEPHLSVLPGGGFTGMETAISRRLSHLRTGSPAKVFGRVGCGEGEPFSKKVFLPAIFSLLQIFIGRLQSCPPALQIFISCLRLALPARFPLRNGCPLWGDHLGTTARSSSYRTRPSCRERRGIKGRRSAGGSPAARFFPNKRSPVDRGQKKTPSRCELQGGLEQSLAAAYFPT